MIVELWKEGFKSGTMCCEWENADDFILQHRIVIKMVINASFCNNIFFLNAVDFKANIAYGAVQKILIK